MALTSANVRLIKSWVEGEVYSKRRKCLMVEVHNITIAASDGMPASAFGMTVIEETTHAYYKKGGATNGSALFVAPTDDGATARIWAAADGSTEPVASQALAATPNGLYLTVKGY